MYFCVRVCENSEGVSLIPPECLIERIKGLYTDFRILQIDGLLSPMASTAGSHII